MDSTTADVQLTQADHAYLQGLGRDESFEKIFEWVAGAHIGRRQLAIKLVSQFGTKGTGQLLTRAFGKGKSPRQRVRLLEAIEQIGIPLEELQLSSLIVGSWRFRGSVFKQMTQLMIWNRQWTTGASSGPTENFDRQNSQQLK